ncbi:hypothetical protein ACJJTC_016828 [Scirpophaga incertulas]
MMFSLLIRTHNPSNADFLFPSEDDEVQREQQQRPKIKKKRTSSPAPSTSRAKYAASHQTEPVQKKKKTVINPVHMKKPTAHDLFGSDSEEEEAQLPVPTPTGNKPIHSYITRRLANGHSRQVYENKQGSHYIDLRVYTCDDIERVQPMNRWRHSIICVKNRTDNNTEAWQHLVNFISATRKEYRNCASTFISNYY